MTTLTSTQAQNGFGSVLERIGRNEVVVVTSHNAARAVVISPERYQALTGEAAVTLDTLQDEFDAFVQQMQTPAVRRGTRRGFRATPAAMGRAAVAAARAEGAARAPRPRQAARPAKAAAKPRG